MAGPGVEFGLGPTRFREAVLALPIWPTYATAYQQYLPGSSPSGSPREYAVKTVLSGSTESDLGQSGLASSPFWRSGFDLRQMLERNFWRLANEQRLDPLPGRIIPFSISEFARLEKYSLRRGTHLGSFEWERLKNPKCQWAEHWFGSSDDNYYRWDITRLKPEFQYQDLEVIGIATTNRFGCTGSLYEIEDSPAPIESGPAGTRTVVAVALVRAWERRVLLQALLNARGESMKPCPPC